MKKVLSLMLVMVLFLTGCGSDSYVIKIGDNNITEGEYQVYFDLVKTQMENYGQKNIWETKIQGQEATDLLEDTVKTELVKIKFAQKKVKELDVKLSEEDKEKVQEEKENFKKFLGVEENKEYDKYIEKYLKEALLTRNLFIKMMDEVELKEEFNQFLAAQKETIESQYAYRAREIVEAEEDLETKEVAEDGDAVSIDFKGFIDGEAFENGEAKNNILVLGSQTFIEGFEEQIVGKKMGEEFDVEVTFPEDYQEESLAGQEAVFKTVLNKVYSKDVIIEKLAEDMFRGQKVEEKFNKELEEWKEEISIKVDEEKLANFDPREENEEIEDVVEEEIEEETEEVEEEIEEEIEEEVQDKE